MLLQDRAARFDLPQDHVVSPERGQMLQHPQKVVLVEQNAVEHIVMQHEPPVAGEVNIYDLDVSVEPADVMLARKGTANALIAPLIVDCADRPNRLILPADDVEQPPLPNELRTQELGDEAFVPVV